MKYLSLIFNLHGYGIYIFAAYSIVFATLAAHFYRVIRRGKLVSKVISQRFK